MNVCESLTLTAKWMPKKTALIFEGKSISYERLNELSSAASVFLARSGVSRGDRVALMLPNTPAFAVWYYAILRLGAIAVSVSTRLASAEIEFVVNDCSAKTLIAPDDLPLSNPGENDTAVIQTNTLGETANGALVEPCDTTNDWVETDRDEPALILYTSGTTGFPKGATLTHGNVRSNVHAFNHLCNMQADDQILLCVPLFHCFGQNALLNSALNVGATLVLQRKFEIHETKQLISEHKVTQLYGVPMMFQMFLAHCEPDDLPSVNYCFSAAATLPPQVCKEWLKKFGMPINQGYGLTETSPFASYNHRVKFVPASIGTPIDSVEMKVVDTETGKPCAPGELGEIAIRGPNVMAGYWNRPEETAAAIRDGWFFSGDIGRIDENGFFFIVDRVKDMISVGGLKVFPAEVERVLLDHQSVQQCAVVGVPDPIFGEQVVAYIVLSQLQIDSEESTSVDQQLETIGKHARDYLGNYKVPRQIILIEELPRNPSGKILKTRLREIFSEANPTQIESYHDADAEPVNQSNFTPLLAKELATAFASERHNIVLRYVQELVQKIGDIGETPSPESRFLDLGLDSLMIVEMGSYLQHEVGPENPLPTTLVFDCPRVCDLVDFLLEKLNPDSNPVPASETHDNSQPSLMGGMANEVDQPIQPSATPSSKELRHEIEEMSEEQALRALEKELE